jgi:hypothetical protein
MMADFFREEERKEFRQALADKGNGIYSGSHFSSHPSYYDRKEMMKSYITQWDKEHPGDEKRA